MEELILQFYNLWTWVSETYWEFCQTCKMERFAKIINGWKPLIIFAKRSILDVWQNSHYASESQSVLIWEGEELVLRPLSLN